MVQSAYGFHANYNPDFRSGVRIVNPDIDDSMFMESQGGNGRSPFLFPLVFLMCFAVLGLVALGYVFREPIKNLARARAEHAEMDRINAQQEIAYQDTAQDVECSIDLLTLDFAELQKTRNTFIAEFESTFSLPVERAHDMRTAPIDHAIATSRESAATWARILNARLDDTTFAQHEQILAEVIDHHASHRLRRLDRLKLSHLRSWIDLQQKVYER